MVGGWVELDRTTLASSNGVIDVTGFPNKRYYQLLWDVRGKNISENHGYIAGDSGGFESNFSTRQSLNGLADTTVASTNIMLTSPAAGSLPFFIVTYMSNLSSVEKLLMTWSIFQNTAGAANIPDRGDHISKWKNTTNSLDRIRGDCFSATFNADTQLVVLGWDPADTHTTNFWEELASVNASGSSTNLSSGTITAKKYLWIQCYLKNTSSHTSDMIFNNDTTSYAYRVSDDGGLDVTSASQSNIELYSATTTPVFVNMFILNNSGNEKLVIGHTVNQNTAGPSTAPKRREFAGKHDNTAQITEIDIDSDSGNWDSKSIIKVWGSN